MPELPEVETVRRTLEPALRGRRIAGVEVRSPHCLGAPADPDAFARALVGRRVARLRRRGKYLLLDLEDGGLLAVHLRMTGRLVYRAPAAPEPAAAAGEAPARDGAAHVHAVLRLEGGGALEFRDVRKFGRLWAVRDEAALPEGFRRLGPDPLGEAFGPEELRRALAGRRSVKAALTDQAAMAGIGSIYADEALFRAGIHPARAAVGLEAGEVRRLWRAIREVLREAVEAGGTTFSDYRDGLDRPGGYRQSLRVYKREGQPCPRCGTPVERARVAGRGARFCPRCQR